MIPTQASCDMDDPEEHVLWALPGIEEMPGVPLLTPEPGLRSLSKQLVEAGFRHHPELQVKKAIIVGAPDAPGVHWMGVGAIQWVDIDTPDPMEAASTEPVIVSKEDFDKASAAQLIAIAEELERRGVVRPAAEVPPPVEDGAIVGTYEPDGDQ
ncbi:phage gene 29 protein family protein [Rhodococcoides fascians]|uniref:phage gene 29 protein family protein n=1 Tax=Rhodococcoides fascians TaxID=1828 RepID=UPI00050D08B3|nr:DUF2744 domain-containing protein [Rhodococcus fascians]